MKKAVIIIEDMPDQYDDIKQCIDPRFSCRQEYTKEDFSLQISGSYLNLLRLSLEPSYLDEKEKEKILASKKKLIDDLRTYYVDGEQPVYIVDYLLWPGRESSINGITFIKKILFEMYPNEYVPVLLITNANFSPKLNVEDYVEKNKNLYCCDFITKPNGSEWYRREDKINSFIDKAISKPRRYGDLGINIFQLMNFIPHKSVSPLTQDIFLRNMKLINEGKTHLDDALKNKLNNLSFFSEENLKEINQIIAKR